MPDPASRPRVIVAPTNLEFGLARMFQILGESARPLLSVVHTLDEALAALGIQFAHFEPLESEKLSGHFDGIRASPTACHRFATSSGLWLLRASEIVGGIGAKEHKREHGKYENVDR